MARQCARCGSDRYPVDAGHYCPTCAALTKPGLLLLSLGDGSAVEVTDPMISNALAACVLHEPDKFQYLLRLAEFKQSLIQQAQEARDA